MKHTLIPLFGFLMLAVVSISTVFQMNEKYKRLEDIQQETFNLLERAIEQRDDWHKIADSLLRYHNLQPETTVIIPKN